MLPETQSCGLPTETFSFKPGHEVGRRTLYPPQKNRGALGLKLEVLTFFGVGFCSGDGVKAAAEEHGERSSHDGELWWKHVAYVTFSEGFTQITHSSHEGPAHSTGTLPPPS